MSHENERPANFWDDEDEAEIASREAYLRTFNSKRPQPPRQGNSPYGTPETPVRRPRPRGVPGSADFYEEIESDQRQARPRPTRQSREEVEARLRQQRGRQAASAREQGGARPRPDAPPSRRPAPRVPEQESGHNSYIPRLDPARQPRPITRDFSSPRATRDFSREAPRTTRDFAQDYPAQRGRKTDYDDYDYGEIEVIEELPQPQRRRRSRSIFSTLLIGCAGGLLTLLIVASVLVFLVLHNTPLGQNLGVGKSTFNQSSLQDLTLGNSTQVIVKNPAGNIVINVDQNASAATLTSVKHVQASSQSDANNQFKQIKLSVTTITQGVDPACLAASCLLVSATTPPASSGGFLGGNSGSSLDLTITLPASFNSPNINVPNIIAASAGAGNISVSGFNGVLNLNGNAGTTNISVTHTLIFAGTCIQTLHGNVTIAQGSIFDLSTPSKLIPCSNTPSSDPQRPWFMIKSGVGNVDITLTTNLNNMLLDANTNNGHISGDFNLNITTNDDSATYHGPLVPNTNPTASLYVATSTGDITLHKQ